jgi:hypothetical protein
MPARKKTMPDVMGEVLGEAASGQAALPVGQQDVVTLKQPGVKVTFYVSPEVQARLDMARVRIRGMLTPGERGAVTLSSIVEAALSLALDDLENLGAVSRLAVKMTSTRDSEGT